MTVEKMAPRRRRSPKGEARRAAILDVALRIFSRDGFQNAAIATIAEQAGLSLPGLLHHFPSKVDLLIAILERRDEESAPLVVDHANDWFELVETLKHINRRNAEQAEVLRAFSILNAESLLDDHPAGTFFRNRVERVRSFLSEVVTKSVHAGQLHETTDPHAIASEIIAMMDGLQILWLRDPVRLDLVTVFDSYLDRMSAGLQNPESARNRA